MPFQPGERLAADDLGDGPNFYTPVLTATTVNPDLGDTPTEFGWWHRVLKQLVFWEIRIEFGTSSTNGDGIYELTLPTAVDGTYHNATGAVGSFSVVGHGAIRDSSDTPGAGSHKVICGLVSLDGGTNGLGKIRLFHMDGTNSTVQEDTPFVWGDGDDIVLSGSHLMQVT